jgi:adenylyltransferase/sulfurtransferase
MAREVLPQIVALRLKDKDEKLVLVDIRPKEERAFAHIEGDVHILTEECEKQLVKYKNKDVVLYCHHGVRSALLADELETKGFNNVASLCGGIAAWSEKVDRKVPQYELH